jgi:hypothetical protein
MKLHSWTRRRKITVLATTLVLATTSVALAAWLVSTNNGRGRGKVATLDAPTVSSPAAFTGAGNLTPGQTGDVQVLVTNPNNAALAFVIAGDNGMTFTPTAGSCPASAFSANPVGATTSTPALIPANAVNLAVTLHGLIKLAATAPDACQGSEVAIGGTNSATGILVNWTTP